MKEHNLEELILIQARKMRNAGSPMSIEEIARFAMFEHKRLIETTGDFNEKLARKFINKNKLKE